MDTSRLEIFSDGVMAIIITIMVLELPIPHGGSFSSLAHVLPKFLAYLLSFASIGIYWNNHHHLLRVTKHVDARIMWANLHLLFWLSLIPFATAWLGDQYQEAWPMAFYGIITLCCAFAYSFLQMAIVKHHDQPSELKKNLRNNTKAKISPLLYFLGVIFAFFLPWVSLVLYAAVSVMWFIPDRRLAEIAHS